MGTWDSYRPERRASWEDIAQTIHDTVTMDEVLSFYCPSTPRRGHRCPCPIHNGKDFNFSYTERGYKCFVCGASGDVIAFVKEVCELSTRADAMKRLNLDLRLNLPIQGEISEAQNLALARRRAEAEEKKRAAESWLNKYHELMDRFIDYQRILMHGDPDSDEYAEAAKKIDYVEDCLNSLPPEPR